MKLLLCITISSIIFAALTVPLGSSFGFAVIFAFASAETVLYIFVPTTGIFSVFRQANIVAAADTANLIGKYLNVNVFGLPDAAALVTLVSSAIIAVIFSAGGILLFAEFDEKIDLQV